MLHFVRTLVMVGATAVLAVAPQPAAAGPAGPGLVWGAGQPNAEGAGGAYAYDARLVPPGTTVSLWSFPFGHRTRTVLVAVGLRPNRMYGVHLHVHACGADPAAAGPHYQQRQGTPDDPDYANARNEVWLDVHTNARGAGVSVTTNPWRYRAAPGSVVLHQDRTSTAPHSPGTAGPRVACVRLHAG